MKYKVAPFGLKYGVKFKNKWWHRWKWIRRPKFTDKDPATYKTLWSNIRGAEVYINQELNKPSDNRN